MDHKIDRVNSAQNIPKKLNRLHANQQIKSGRAVNRENQQNNQSSNNLAVKEEIDIQGLEQQDADGDDFDFDGIDFLPVQEDLDSNNNNAQSTFAGMQKNMSPKRGEVQNLRNNGAESQVEDMQVISQFFNNETSQNPLKLSIQNRQQPNRLPRKQLKTQKNNHQATEQIQPNFNNVPQLTQSSLNAFLPNDYTKDKDLSYAKMIQKEINRKKPQLPYDIALREQMGNQLPNPENQDNIRQSFCINNVFSDDFFAGRVSLTWLFIISRPSPELIAKIQQVYRPITDRDYEMPFCRNTQEALQFFKAQNCLFKVIVDLDNVQELIAKPELQSKIKSIYLFNSDPVNGLQRSIILKASSKKIIGFFLDLSPLLKQAQTDIQNGNKFQRLDQGTIAQIKFRSSLPTFIKLNSEDKSEITSYRINLYGAIKLTDQKQRQEKLVEFNNLVKRVYSKDQNQMNYLQEYLKTIDHISSKPNDSKKHFDVLRFYVQESFYYKLTNNMLRICRTVEQFKPLTIPFNENYHAIKHFYQQSITQNKLGLPVTLYRGATLKQMDFQNLKEGDYIELLGFISTSRNQEYTKKNFINKAEDYLFSFTIKSREIPDDLKQFDHGFFELAQYNIATTQFEAEQEVLLNALNIYRITRVIPPEKSKDGVGRIHLEYGAIFDLYQKDPVELSPDQINVLNNYRFCIKEMKEIQDHGDVLMKTEEYDKCKQFYQEKITHQKKVQYFNKLAEAQLHCGQTNQARANAIQSLLQYQQDLKIQAQLNQEQCAKIYQIHHKNTKILLENEDTLHAKKSLQFQLDLIDQNKDWLLKAQKLMQRGSINLKEGNLIESQKDLKLSQNIIEEKKRSFNVLRDQIRRKYFFRMLCKCFFFKENTPVQKNNELSQVDHTENQMIKLNDKVHELLLHINECFMNVAEIVGDKKTYKECVEKGKRYFEEMPKKATKNPFEIASIKVIEAKIENAFQQTQNVQNSITLMEQAIGLIKQINPMHEKVGDYSLLLGKFHKREMKNAMTLPSASKSNQQIRSARSHSLRIAPEIAEENERYNDNEQPENGARRQVFDEQEYKQRYIKTKQKFEEALAVVTYRKTQNHPKVFEIRNQLGQVQYEYSNFKQGKQQAFIVLRTEGGPKHSEGAKSALLIAKTHLSEGQVKDAFQFIQKAHSILRFALVKQQNNAKYTEILQLSPIFMEIELFKCKIYNRQMQHDLALTSIKNLRDIGKRKHKDPAGVGYLADIYEEMANILVCQGDTIKFQKYYEKAVSLRQHEMGKYNMTNAICYCTMAKYLIFTNDIESAKMYLKQAFEIFSRFAYNHPYFWIQLSTMAYLSQTMNEHEKEIRELQESVRLIEKRYSKTHINLMKMKVRYAEVLMKNNKLVEALPIYESLSKQMEGDVSLSRRKIAEQPFEEAQVKQTENEKVAIRNQVQKSLKETQLQISRSRDLLRIKQTQGITNPKLGETPDGLNQSPQTQTTKVKIGTSSRIILNEESRASITEFDPSTTNQQLFILQ